MLLSDLSAFVVIGLVAVVDKQTYIGLRPDYFTYAETYAVFFFCTFAFILWDFGSVYVNTEIRKWMEIRKVEDKRIEKEEEENDIANFAVS